ncbi:XRE family transcriptional regulator [Glaciimonas sp. Gout2]|uniref:helix-turn-helix domain-containing protein n=1 Tax=unclassified Glaciimonas TaxID=2644401 RepID=UPI002AB4F341|nr:MULTISPECIES: XRE family transcriptional regulator [unclassified Glaciimonas]MDY7548592.1 XRE family transcriptional regulator [Glaciimonas sp. CA11.2]MEB0013779.1 XRE family transcriptional regulator [Glaciimonas sp. Cout2]MEB0084521.1 XRE family transcriptional regulator [Glaciimonas sp. Gout2]
MTMPQLGKTIRTRRHAVKKTLMQIAVETGLTAGFISQVERNLTTPSITSLVVIAKALGVLIGDLIKQPEQIQPDSYQDRRQTYRVASGPVKYERLSTVFPGSRVHSVKFTMPSGYKSEMVSHEGDEMVFVLSGQVEYTVGLQHFVLCAGDSLHFDGNIPHTIEALMHKSKQAELLWVGTAQLFDDESDNVVEEKQGNHERFLKGTEFS